MNKLELSMIVSVCTALRENKVNAIHLDYAEKLETIAREKIIDWFIVQDLIAKREAAQNETVMQ